MDHLAELAKFQADSIKARREISTSSCGDRHSRLRSLSEGESDVEADGRSRWRKGRHSDEGVARRGHRGTHEEGAARMDHRGEDHELHVGESHTYPLGNRRIGREAAASGGDGRSRGEDYNHGVVGHDDHNMGQEQHTHNLHDEVVNANDHGPNTAPQLAPI